MFERTHDLELVRRLLTDPGIYGHVTDDFAPAPHEFVVPDHPDIWYVAVTHAAHFPQRPPPVLGMFLFYPQNAICWDVHVAFRRGTLPHFTRAAGAGILAWLWARTPCLRIEAAVPICNRAALRYGVDARGMALIPYAVRPPSFAKRGRVWPQVLMGRSRGT